MKTVEISHNEKVEMYRLVDKEQLIEMLIEANNTVDRLTSNVNLYMYSNNHCNCIGMTEVHKVNDKYLCGRCGKPIKGQH
jgi:ArsR family metal-binding transcriptional regulator